MRKPITTNISMKDLGARELGDWMLVTFPFTLDYFVDDNRFVMVYHRRKKWNDSLEGSLDWELFPAELEFPKILVSRLPQNSSNVNIECRNISSFCYSDINLFSIDYVCCKLFNIWLLIFENNSSSYHYTGASHWRKNIVAVVTQDRW